MAMAAPITIPLTAAPDPMCARRAADRIAGAKIAGVKTVSAQTATARAAVDKTVSAMKAIGSITAAADTSVVDSTAAAVTIRARQGGNGREAPRDREGNGSDQPEPHASDETAPDTTVS